MKESTDKKVSKNRLYLPEEADATNPKEQGLRLLLIVNCIRDCITNRQVNEQVD
ncbi:unnamed protein product, partial [Linum tenue]